MKSKVRRFTTTNGFLIEMDTWSVYKTPTVEERRFPVKTRGAGEEETRRNREAIGLRRARCISLEIQENLLERCGQTRPLNVGQEFVLENRSKKAHVYFHPFLLPFRRIGRRAHRWKRIEDQCENYRDSKERLRFSPAKIFLERFLAREIKRRELIFDEILSISLFGEGVCNHYRSRRKLNVYAIEKGLKC